MKKLIQSFATPGPLPPWRWHGRQHCTSIDWSTDWDLQLLGGWTLPLNSNNSTIIWLHYLWNVVNVVKALNPTTWTRCCMFSWFWISFVYENTLFVQCWGMWNYYISMYHCDTTYFAFVSQFFQGQSINTWLNFLPLSLCCCWTYLVSCLAILHHRPTTLDSCK